MNIAVIGSNGMLSVALTKAFMQDGHCVEVFGLNEPKGYECTRYYPCDLLEHQLNYEVLVRADVIIYASGAGVQAALSTPSELMYALNVSAPIEITLRLKKMEYKGCYISFGSYMEIGVNDEDGRAFSEEEVVCSKLAVTNDYALSKRLYGRYMKDFTADFNFLHFILPNMFSYEDKKPGTRLIPYVLQYCRDFQNGNQPKEPSFSAGTQTRQYILLEELKNVIENAVNKKIPSGIYNVGGGKFCSVRETIENLFKLFDVPCKENFFGQSVRRDGDIRSLRIDGSKLFRAIGFLPSLTMSDVFKD